MAVMVMTSLSLFSCEKLVEIPGPPSAITQQDQFADSATALSAITGVYGYSQSNGFPYTDGRLTYLTALSADELSTILVNDNQQFYSYTITPMSSGASSLWQHAYKSIYQVNAVLAGVTGNPALTESFQRQVIGEMEVTRALFYFNLVNQFGGVPLILTTDYNATKRLPRNSVEEVYARINQDLADAETKLTDRYPSDGRVRPNFYVAKAFRAKVDLYQENWQSAYNAADSVIRLGGYGLEIEDLNKVFLDGSKEAIWQIPGEQPYSTGVADAQNFLPYYEGALPNYLLTDYLLDAFEIGDKRKAAWVGVTNVTVNGALQTQYYPFKYKSRLPATPREDQMIIRLGELYLIRAEAAAHLGKLTDALKDVDLIRSRAGLLPSTANSSSEQEVLDAIMNERQVELFCEWGNRWYDLKRTGKAMEVLGSEKTGYKEDAALYPIPQTQRSLNTTLEQNPGYTN